MNPATVNFPNENGNKLLSHGRYWRRYIKLTIDKLKMTGVTFQCVRNRFGDSGRTRSLTVAARKRLRWRRLSWHSFAIARRFSLRFRRSVINSAFFRSETGLGPEGRGGLVAGARYGGWK